MKWRVLSISLFLAALLHLAACGGMQESTTSEALSLPEVGNSITVVGNPNDEPDVPKAVYFNRAYNVKIEYPAAWVLDEINASLAHFSYSDRVSLFTSFAELAAGEDVDAFLNEIRSGRDGLEKTTAPGFDEALCATPEALEGRIVTQECYYFRTTGPRPFVMTVTGITTGELLGVSSYLNNEMTWNRFELFKKNLLPLFATP